MIFANFRELFTQLEQQLWHYQAYWQFQPMQQAAVADPYHFLPQNLVAALQQFDLTECAELDSDDVALMQRLGVFFPELHCPTIARHCAILVSNWSVRSQMAANLPIRWCYRPTKSAGNRMVCRKRAFRTCACRAIWLQST